MAQVQVSRQTLDGDNQLGWSIVMIDETELLEGELPYEAPPAAE